MQWEVLENCYSMMKMVTRYWNHSSQLVSTILRFTCFMDSSVCIFHIYLLAYAFSWLLLGFAGYINYFVHILIFVHSALFR